MRWVSIIFAAVATLAMSGAAQGQSPFQDAPPWPTTDFEVRVETPPFGDGAEAVEQDLDFDPVEITLEDRVEIEAWLKRVAQYLEKAGFRPPHLEIKPSRYSPPKPNGVYEVYVYDFGGANPAFYHGGCRELGANDGDSSYMRIDAALSTNNVADVENVIEAGDLTDGGKRTLAHELFHAVQASYPLFRSNNCKVGAWLIEGSAEGFEVHAVEELLGKSYTGPDFEDGLLPRSYATELYVRPLTDGGSAPDGYDTGSFWLYLAELAAAGPGKIPEIDGGDRDISYLHDIFQIGRSGSDRASELTWLKDVLALRFRRRLPGVFSEFITLYAGYVPARAGLASDVEDWRQDLFVYCEDFELTRSAPRADFPMIFNPVAAQCVELTLETTDEVELFVFARNKGDHLNDVDALKNVFVGVPGTHVVDRADLTLPADIAAENEDIVAMWRVPFDPVVDDAIVISSIATITADNPNNGPIEFTILHPEWQSSLTQKPGRPAPASRGEGESGHLNEEKADATARSTAHLDTFSQTSRSSVSMSRRPDWPSCEEPFKFQVCGPYMTVSLELTPGSLFDMGATSGRGGVFAQFAGNVLAAGEATGGGMAGLMEWVKRQESIPGHQITMTFPMIDYGFTGSFNNALISAQIEKHVEWKTVGPSDAMPGPGQMYAFSGTVTIEEYSPEILRGTYSGGLVDGADGVDAGDDPTLPIKHSLSGSFVIAAPLMDDDRTHVINPMSYGGIGEDFEIFMPGVSTPVDELLEQIAEDAAANPANSYSPDASVGELCDCSCNYAERASPVCADFCSFSYQACEGRAFTPAPRPAAMTASEAAAALADLRDRYETFLLETTNEDHAAVHLQIFDSLDMPYKDKKLWLEAGDPTGFVAWEREQRGEPDPRDYEPPAEEAAEIAALREAFYRHLLDTKTEWQADNIIEFFDEEVHGPYEDRKAWVASVAPDFAE